MVFGIIACNKKNSINETTAKANSNTIFNNAYTVGNTNALNSLGYVHNLSLDQIASDGSFPNLTEQQEYEIIQPFVNNELLITSTVPYSSISDGVAYVKASEENMLNLPASLYSSGRITSDMKDYLLSIYAAAGFVTNQTVQGVRSSQDVIDDIEDIESDIISDYGNPSTNPEYYADMNNNESKATYLLAFCAIVKHSYGYWEAVREDQNHPWHVPTFSGTNDNGRFWDTKFGKFLTTVFHDACGFIEEGSDVTIENGDLKYKVNIVKGVKGAIKASA